MTQKLRFCCNLPVLVCICLIGNLQAAPPEQPDSKTVPPLLSKKVNEIDGGLHHPNATTVIRIPFRNDTSAAIELHSYEASCGCSKVSMVPRKVVPEQDGEFIVHLTTGGLERDVAYRLIIQTRKANTKPEPISQDEFLISLKIREPCSFFGQNAFLSTTTSTDAPPFEVRAVNYSDKRWENPTARFVDTNIDCKVSEKIKKIDGKERQVVIASVDRVAFSKQMSGKWPTPIRSKLRVFSRPADTEDLSEDAKPLGEFHIRVRVLKSVQVHPAVVNWRTGQQDDIVLIVISRGSVSSFDSEDFKVLLGKDRLEASYEEIRPGWGKLVIATEGVNLPRDMKDPALRVSVPNKNFVQFVRLRKTHHPIAKPKKDVPQRKPPGSANGNQR